MKIRLSDEERCGKKINKRDGRQSFCAMRTGHPGKAHRDAEMIRKGNIRAAGYSRKYNLRNMGVSEAWYATKLSEQGGHCAICPRTPEENGKALAVDHDHNCCPTKMKSCGNCVRGLLCDSCNLLLGHANDDPDIILAALKYLT